MRKVMFWIGVALGAVIIGSMIDSPFGWLALLIFIAWWEINGRIEDSHRRVMSALERLYQRGDPL